MLATDKAIEDIRRTTRGKDVAFAWSGGKDSIALADVCKKAGVDRAMWAHTELEYPAFFDWCQKHKPENCEIINTGYDLDWIIAHPNMLFPNDADHQKWMAIYQRKSFSKCFFDDKLDMLMVGHRKADGNIVGEGNIITKNSGEVRYSPLADWSHEMLLGYIYYFNLEMPMIYWWRDGFRKGTHPWAGRTGTKSLDQGYEEVWEIDPQIVVEAAHKLDSAKYFLERKMNHAN